MPLAVVKVGGSLYDLPHLGVRLRAWLRDHLPDTGVLLIPGGGPTVDALRRLDPLHALGEETSHWLALRALTLNAHFLSALLPPARVLTELSAWDGNELAILDVHAFARADEAFPGHLPHSWAATSDAFAARVALVLQAKQLVLLKSTTIPPEVDWREAARCGWVDELFAEVLRDAPADLRVRAVNLPSCRQRGIPTPTER
jgi:aspartokinase-like uncharacterized kinase